MAKIKFEEQIGGVWVDLVGDFIGVGETDELRHTLRKLAEVPQKKLLSIWESLHI